MFVYNLLFAIVKFLKLRIGFIASNVITARAHLSSVDIRKVTWLKFIFESQGIKESRTVAFRLNVTASLFSAIQLIIKKE